MPDRLKDKIIFITGAGGGIGRQTVHLLLERGASVYATDFDASAVERLNERYEGVDRFMAEKHDVRSAKEWSRAFENAVQHFGRVDALINNAGVLKPGYIAESKPEDVDFHFDVNVKGVMYGSQIAAAYMKERRTGHIINIASLAGVAPIPGITLYSASKFAVRGFSLALHSELRPANVKVTCICPDAVQTPMLDIQKKYEEAALTFSGSILNANQVATTIADALQKDELEILEPWNRGMLAKLVNMSPALSNLMLSTLQKQGLENQKKMNQK